MRNNRRKILSTIRITRGLMLILAATLMASAPPSRVSADAGDLDTSFGTNGIVVTDLGGNELAQSVSVQRDGRIVIGVNSLDFIGGDFTLIRYNADGTLDTSFGFGGFAETDFLGFGGIVTSVRIDAQGRILAAGYIQTSSQPHQDIDFALARFTPNGLLDTTFGSQGKVLRNHSTFDSLAEIAIQANGKIVVAGASRSDEGGVDFALFRLTSSGRPDFTFANGQVVLTDFYGGYDHGHAIALQSDGRILVGGRGHKASHWDFALARYNANGTLDATFGGAGKVITRFTSQNDFCTALLLRPQPDGGEQIIAAGSTSFNSLQGDFAMACYLPDGSLNSGFGLGGKVVTDFTGNYDYAQSALLQQDGKIVLAGAHYSGNDFALARYDANGGLDSSFGNGGKVMTTVGIGSHIEQVALGLNGEIVAAGRASQNVALAKYLP
jgi:uncharacterized delta-60 repeat protein